MARAPACTSAPGSPQKVTLRPVPQHHYPPFPGCKPSSSTLHPSENSSRAKTIPTSPRQEPDFSHRKRAATALLSSPFGQNQTLHTSIYDLIAFFRGFSAGFSPTSPPPAAMSSRKVRVKKLSVKTVLPVLREDQIDPSEYEALTTDNLIATGVEQAEENVSFVVPHPRL